jgi:hypothetical protein
MAVNNTIQDGYLLTGTRMSVMPNPVTTPLHQFVCGANVDGDALALLLVIVATADMTDQEVGTFGPLLGSHHCIQGRYLQLPQDRYEKALKALLDTGELTMNADPDGIPVYRIARWEQYLDDMAQFGHRRFNRKYQQARRLRKVGHE